MASLRTFGPELVLNSIHNGIIAINSEGLVVCFNRAAERIFCILASEAIQRCVSDVLPNIGIKLAECLKTGVSFHGEVKDKEAILLSSITPTIDDGQTYGVVGVFQDTSNMVNNPKDRCSFENMTTDLRSLRGGGDGR